MIWHLLGSNLSLKVSLPTQFVVGNSNLSPDSILDEPPNKESFGSLSQSARVCGNPCVHSRATHPSLIHSTQTTSLKKEWKINISQKGNIYFGFGFQSAGFSLIHANIQHIQLYKIFILILFSIKVIKCICEAAGVVTEVLWCDLQMYLSVGRAAQSLNHKIMAVGIKTKPLKGDFHVPGINTNQINTICCCPFTGNHPLKHLDQLIEIKPKQTQAMS